MKNEANHHLHEEQPTNGLTTQVSAGRKAAMAYDDGSLETGGAGLDPVAMVRRSLRGRMAWVAGLSAVGLVAGSMIGYFVTHPLYKSEALLSIANTVAPVIQTTDQNAQIVMFESYLRSQQLKMSSRSLVEKALINAEPTAKISPEMVVDAADWLTVEHPAGSENLHVTFVDREPLRAERIDNAIVEEFRKEYEDTNKAHDSQRIELLVSHAKELQTQLDALQKRAEQLVTAGTTQSKPASDPKQDLINDRINIAMQMLHDYQLQEVQIDDKLDQLRDSGLMDGHPQMVSLKDAKTRAHARVTAFQAEVQRLRGLATSQSPTAPTQTNPSDQPIIMRPADDANAQALRQSEFDAVTEQSAEIRKQLAEVSERIEALKMEGVESRLDIISPGEIPITPFKDRRMPFAVAGGLAGLCLPTLVLVGLGLLRPRYRFSDETSNDVSGPAGLLGILPVLPLQMSDPETAAGAAQCVHQMRVMLQVSASNEHRQYLLTSGCAGEGKTSIALSLALSFAAAGSRTLVVDADLVGRALTRGFGFSNERGLYEALGNGDATPFVRQTQAGLWFLPAGRANALHASKVSRASVRRFLEKSRKEYDVVIIDSGPVLGSIEAATFAPEVDGVIVTVSRGQQPMTVERTTQHLRSMGARIEGFIFNRAKPKDFYRSSYASSVRPMSSREMMVRVLSAESDGMLRFGPLVESVVSSLPANDYEDEDALQVSDETEAAVG